MHRLLVPIIAAAGLALGSAAGAAEPPAWPGVTENDFTLRDGHFRSGQTLPDLRIHYRPLGTPTLDAPTHA
jgi:homoserine O-acetyltransferase